MNEAILKGPQTQGAESRCVPAALWLRRLSLSNFRCYAEAVLEADARPVVLTGPNGAGKTNLLEAISFLGPGRGLRRARLTEVDRQRPAEADGPAPWAVAAEVMTQDGPRQIGTGRDPGAGAAAEDSALRERRTVKIDGAFVRRQQDLGEIVNLVWLTPQMDGLFRDGASGRRRFFDRLIYGFDPGHAGRLTAYEHALRERARLLKNRAGDGAWLEALEETMAGHAVAIAAARRALVERLNGACAMGVGPFPQVRLALVGDVEAWLAEMPALDCEERLRAGLRDSRPRDAESGGAAFGPQRSDVAAEHLGKRLPAPQCSTGEQKALIVAIVLAHARLQALDRGAAPLLLLDEIAAHLDDVRRAALFEELLALGAQAWLTGTDAALFTPFGDRAQFVQVRDAVLALAAGSASATMPLSS